MILPSHGAVLGTFHLAHSLRHGPVHDAEIWVRKSATKGSFASAAIDHRPLALLLLESPLVHVGGEILPDRRLVPLSYRADRATLLAIAALLLEFFPPPWLSVAVSDGIVMPEFIPDDELRELDWLRPELDMLLVDASGRADARDTSLRLGLGRAAELVVFETLQSLGRRPVHVADVSDTFGYDVETAVGPVLRWEVKGSVEASSYRFNLTRNEFDKSQRYGAEWLIIQVEFSARIFSDAPIGKKDIRAMRTIDSSALARLVPKDTDYFRWADNAVVAPAPADWVESDLAIPDSLLVSSISSLAEHAAAVHASRLSSLRIPRLIC